MTPVRFFLLNLFVLVVLSTAYLMTIRYTGMKYNTTVPVIFAAFALMNQGFYRMLLKAHKKRPQLFITAFLGVVGIKLMSAIVFLLVYLVAFKSDDVIYVAVSLFMAYISFTILLIRAALRATSTND